MCFQLVESYSDCGCIFYRHRVDRCSAYGKPRHIVEQKEITVASVCSIHNPTRRRYGIPVIDEIYYAPRLSSIALQAAPSEQASVEAGGSGFDNSKVQASETLPLKQSDEFQRDQPVQEAGHDGGRRVSREYNSHQAQKPPPENVRVKDLSISANGLGPVAEADKSTCESISGTEPAPDVAAQGAIAALKEITRIMRQPSLPPVPPHWERPFVLPTLAVFRRLIFFQDLCFLWPQVVRLCGSRQRAVDKVVKFLQDYADAVELVTLHLAPIIYDCDDANFTETLRKRVPYTTSNSIRTAAHYLATRIVKSYRIYLSVNETESAPEQAITGKERVKGRIFGDELRNLRRALPIVEHCLYDTESVILLQNRVRAFVALPRPKTRRAWDRVTMPAKNMMASLTRPRPRAGTKRVTWTCVGYIVGDTQRCRGLTI
jgi:hypothetical protein